MGGGDQRHRRIAPGLEATFQRLGLRARMAQPGGRALAELQTLLADQGDVAPREAARPLRDIAVGAADGGGEEARIGGGIFIGTDIDQHGASGRPMRRASCGTVTMLGAGMVRPLLREMCADAMLRPEPHGVIAIVPLAAGWEARLRLSSAGP